MVHCRIDVCHCVGSLSGGRACMGLEVMFLFLEGGVRLMVLRVVTVCGNSYHECHGCYPVGYVYPK